MTFDADAVNAIKNSGAGSDVTLDVKGVEKVKQEIRHRIRSLRNL